MNPKVHEIVYSCDSREELAERIVKLEDENAKMREKYYKYESKMDSLVCELTGGLLSKSATLPNDALYSVIEEQMTDELVDENFKLTLENAKLRKLARGMYGMLSMFDAILGNHDACETPRPLIFGEGKSFKDVMRELGIKVSQ